MFAIILRCLLLVSSAVTTPLQLAAPKASLSNTDAPALATLDAFQCYDPSFPPPGPFYLIIYSECRAAADKYLANVRRGVPSVFSRSEDADIRLPWRVRSGNSMMSLDVLNEGDEDIMCVQDAHEIAILLCRMCAGGYYRYGGRTPVGPRGVIFISVYGMAPVVIEATEPIAPQPSHVIAREIDSSGLALLDTSSLAPTDEAIPSASNADTGKCFNESVPSPRGPPYPVISSDCLNAAEEMLIRRPAFTEMTFGRGVGMEFRLPWSARSESCIVRIDTPGSLGFDKLALLDVFETATDRIEECTKGDNIFGGSRAVGPKAIVYVYVYGVPPLPPSAPALPPSIHLVKPTPAP